MQTLQRQTDEYIHDVPELMTVIKQRCVHNFLRFEECFLSSWRDSEICRRRAFQKYSNYLGIFYKQPAFKEEMKKSFGEYLDVQSQRSRKIVREFTDSPFC